MRNRRNFFAALGLLGLAFYNVACDSADNPIAPSGSVLIVTANPTRISVNGQATITVRGFKPDNNPLNEGTVITLNTTFGTLDSTSLTADGSGQATTILRGSGTTGAAEVTASLPGGGGGGEGGGGGTTGSVTVQIGEDEASTQTLTISASPNTISLGESAEVTAVARNADGSLLGAGSSVSLRTDLGLLRSGFVTCAGSGSSSITVDTNSDGEAEATLCAGDQVGTATITGSVGASAEETTTVAIENQTPNILISANPSIIPVAPDPASGSPVLSEITIIVRDNNNLPVGADRRIRLTADLGTVVNNATAQIPIDEVFTDSQGEAVVFFLPGQRAGTGIVRANFENLETPAEVQITIQDAPGSLLLSANPTSIQRIDEGTMVTLRATVRGAQGDTLGGILVDFDPQRGTLDQTQVTTNAQGVATVTLTVTSQDVQSIPANGVFTVTATATSEGVTVADDVEITVLGAP